MKKSDIAMIILIASVSILASYFVAKTFIGDVKSDTVKVKTAESIKSEIVEPDATVFNKDAVNPTIEVTIGSDGQTATDKK